VVFRTVAASGLQAPGEPSGVEFSDLSIAASINDLGQVAFSGKLIGPGVDPSNDEGIWSGAEGALQLVVREGRQVPGEDPGVAFGGPYPPSFNNAGQTAWLGGTNAPDGRRLDTGVWSEGTGSTAPVAQLRHQIPGMNPGIVFDQIGARNLIDDSGLSALSASVIGPGVDDTNNRILWRGAGGNGTVLARESEHAPGAEAGVNFRDFIHPHIKGAGHLAIQATLEGPGVDSTNDTGLWTTDYSGTLKLVARTGSQAPGADPDAKFDVFGYSDELNDLGMIAFRAELTGTNVDSTNNTGLWAHDGEHLRLIAREGDPKPQIGPGVELGELGTGLSINNAGMVGLQSLITGPGVDASNDTALWIADASTLSLVARTGSQAPGVDPGLQYSSLSSLLVNNAGQMAFNGHLTGPGIDGSNDRGIWAKLGQELELILREGDSFKIAQGDTRIIDTLAFWRDVQFNDQGQLLIYASFTDGSEGLIVAMAPEPLSGVIIGSGMLLMLKRPRV